MAAMGTIRSRSIPANPACWSPAACLPRPSASPKTRSPATPMVRWGPIWRHTASVPLPERTLTFVAKQGEAIGRTGYVGVAVASDQHGAPQSVTISGNAVTVFRTTIALDTPPQQDPQ